MEQLNRFSLQYKMVLPWALPLLGLFYAYFSAPQSLATNILLVTAMLCVAGAIISWMLGQRVVTGLGQAIKSANASANRDFSFDPPLTGQDEITHLLYTMGNLRTSFRSMASNEGAEAAAAESEMLMKALEVCDTNVMIADTNFDIQYMNKSVNNMMRAAESDLKQDLPNFNASTLIGTNIDTFHKNPAHQRGMVQNLTSTYSTQIEVGGRTFNLIANPINSDSGERLGTIVEWQDLTAELAQQAKDEIVRAENSRNKQALDVCQANVMMADADLNIVYLNNSVKGMMREAQSDIQKDLPNFDVNSLLGFNVDGFHKNPAHQRGMLKDLSNVYETSIEVGGRTFALVATPVFEEGKRLGTVVEWVDQTAALKQQAIDEAVASENSRTRQALDVCQANVMMADADLNIVYLNDSVKQMLTDAQSDIRTELPNFNVSTLMGFNVDGFHKNPSHQRGMLQDLKETYNTSIEVGGRTFALTATPVFNEGERLGTVVEWVDKTAALKQQAIDDAVSAENSRTRQALDVCQANVMMADADLNIVYLNDSVKQMLGDAEADIKTDLPNFSVSTLMGFNVDGFHKNPAHQRGMLKDLKDTYNTAIVVGGRTFALTATPVFSEDTRLGTVVEWVDQTETLKQQAIDDKLAQENARTSMALDVCQANVMMADADLNIVYMNESVKVMLTDAQSDIKKDLPNFNVGKLMGFNVDGFHKDPSHQRGMLQELKSVYNTSIVVGGRTFDLTATPVWVEGERLGTVVEWQDQTEALKQKAIDDALAQENSRTSMALDVCQANVMMADADLNIVYLNQSVKNMLSAAQSDIKTDLPNFDVGNLMGFNVDGFHKNPAHQRGMLKDLQETYNTSIVVGGRTFALVATPVWVEGDRLGTVVEWEDKTAELARLAEEKRVSDENTRVKLALDACTANTMIADVDFNVIYTNKAVDEMLATAEADIKTDLPNFAASKVLGSNIDIFHKNPAHQRNMVGNLTSTYSTEIIVGGRTFGLTANPINSDSGERLGTVVEWNDRTEEVAVEKEVDGIIESAGRGDLTVRASIDDKKGFFKNLSMGLNRLVGIAENVINDTARILDAMSNGKLSERIDADYEGIFDKLKTDANTTGDKLTDIITNIRDAAGTVATGSTEIAQGNTDLSQRTEEQASSLEEIASSMEEMTSSVKQTAENANHANELAGNAQDKARKGGEVVGKAVVAMDEINSSSKKIADIIGVIDEIAFQTNLLALNAAVEAARAGEQGKGFAVVAGEVRNLAQRSAGAAKEIKDLIRDSVEKVDNGTELVNESGTTLNEIVDAVEKVSNMIKEISNAAEEQSSGINQVNTAIGQMDEMTQQNAALVEEASAASETMTEQAKSMQDLVGFFQMAGAGGGGARPAVRSAPAMSMSAGPKAVAMKRPPVADDGDDWQEF